MTILRIAIVVVGMVSMSSAQGVLTPAAADVTQTHSAAGDIAQSLTGDKEKKTPKWDLLLLL